MIAGMGTRGWLYDRERAVRQDVRLSRSGSDLLLELPEERCLTVPPGRLVHVESRDSAEVYGRGDIPGWRLGVEDPEQDVAALLPPRQVYGRWIDRLGLVPFIGIAIVVSAALLFAAGRFPQWAAPLVPPAWEERFGDTLVGDFGGKFCNGRGGQAALDKLAAQLSPKAGALNIRVADIGFVNAAALPGGNIVIFEELLSQADGPDEVAGVLAHEIAHVEERHVTQALLRELGAGIFIAAFGGTTGANINNLMAASYSRESEREADAGAIAALKRAGISPVPTAKFFERMAEQDGKLSESLSYISSHPVSRERRRAFLASADARRTYRPSLTRDEWDALADICHNDRSSAQ